MPSNDNHSALPMPSPLLPDAHGHAALLLIESLIHGLVERSILTLAEGVEIVATAIDVQVDVARAADGAGAPMWHAHSLLSRMSDSFEIDLDK